MNFAEFKDQLARLRKRYGDKAYDDDFAKLLWRDIQFFSDGSMTKVVDLIIGEHFRPIGKSAIIEILKQESARNGKVLPKSRIIPKNCDGCMGDGLIFLFDDRGSRFVFSCDKCPNGAIQREISGRMAPHVLWGLEKGFRRSHVRTA